MTLYTTWRCMLRATQDVRLPDPGAPCAACLHPRLMHYRERDDGSCLHSTPTETWACDCTGYVQPRPEGGDE